VLTDIVETDTGGTLHGRGRLVVRSAAFGASADDLGPAGWKRAAVRDFLIPLVKGASSDM